MPYKRTVFVFAHVLVGYASVLATYLYLPMISAIASSFKCPLGFAQITVAAYFLGIALPRLIYGVIAEKVGIYRILQLGMLIFVLGGFVCIYASNIFVLTIGRFMQGFGMSAAGVLGMPILCDLYPQKKKQHFLISLITAINAIGPPMGVYLSAFISPADWHIVFFLTNTLVLIGMGGYSIGIDVSTLGRHWQGLKLRAIFVRLSQLVVNKRFIYYAYFGSFSYAVLIMMITSLPVLLSHGAKFYIMSAPNSYALILLFLLLGSLSNAFWGGRFRSEAKLLVSIFIILNTFICQILFPHFLFSFIVMAFLSGVIIPVCLSSTLLLFSSDKYLMSSAYTFATNLVIACLTGLVGFLPMNSVISFSIIVIILALLALGVLSSQYFIKQYRIVQ